MKWLRHLLSKPLARQIDDLEFKLALTEGELRIANAKLKAAELKLLERKAEGTKSSKAGG